MGFQSSGLFIADFMAGRAAIVTQHLSHTTLQHYTTITKLKCDKRYSNACSYLDL